MTNVKANLMIPKQPLNAGKMRLRSGIKTPSAEKPLEPVPPPSAAATPTPKPTSQPPSARRDQPASAKRDPSPRKRKAEPVQEGQEAENVEEESEDEMAELEGALSAGEDDDESEPDDDEHEHEHEHESDNDQANIEDASDDEDELDEDEDDALHSDDAHSDDDESSGKIPSLKPGQVPGLDPDDLDNGDEDLRNYRVETDANGNEKYVYDEIDPVYDSDDTDANEPANTIGDIDLKFYDSYPHIGYDINGKKIMRPAAGDALDALLDSIEVPKGWTGLTDPATGKPLNLSQNELELIKKIQRNELQDGFDPYPVCLVHSL